jgi:hypothetical protein
MTTPFWSYLVVGVGSIGWAMPWSLVVIVLLMVIFTAITSWRWAIFLSLGTWVLGVTLLGKAMVP